MAGVFCDTDGTPGEEIDENCGRKKTGERNYPMAHPAFTSLKL
jgi:hypothetical protein